MHRICEHAHLAWCVALNAVLLHGFTQTGRSWAPVRAEIGERYRCFAPDLPGHGDMAWRRPATPGAFVAYLRALPEARFVLCGYSMGGRLALRFALEHPERVERLVLVSCGAGIADAAERAARLAEDLALADRIEATPLEAFVDEWAAQPLLAGLPRGIAEAAREDRLRNEPAGLAAALRGLGQGACEPMWDRLGELAMPVRLVAGERDAKYRAIAEATASRVPHAQVICVADAGHAVNLENAEAVAAAIVAA
jgi:2-succinyl-6-hydroxy-2,4-cyclohexadiene-1-carboxylate synthase